MLACFFFLLVLSWTHFFFTGNRDVVERAHGVGVGFGGSLSSVDGQGERFVVGAGGVLVAAEAGLLADAHGVTAGETRVVVDVVVILKDAFLLLFFQVVVGGGQEVEGAEPAGHARVPLQAAVRRTKRRDFSLRGKLSLQFSFFFFGKHNYILLL